MYILIDGIEALDRRPGGERPRLFERRIHNPPRELRGATTFPYFPARNQLKSLDSEK